MKNKLQTPNLSRTNFSLEIKDMFHMQQPSSHDESVRIKTSSCFPELYMNGILGNIRCIGMKN